MNPPYQIRHGDILLAKCDPSIGAEMRKIRPCIVVQGTHLNKLSTLFTVIPITSRVENAFVGDVPIKKEDENRLSGDCLARTSQIFTFDRSRFLKLIGRCSHAVLRQIKKQIILNLELDV